MRMETANPNGEKNYLLRVSLLLLVIVGACCLMASLPRIAQDKSYHLFADAESLLGMNNGSNVLSNVAFIVAGIVGLKRTKHLSFNTVTFIWRFFFCAVTFVGIGSAYYHWAPSNDTLLWDRLPMTLGFAALTAGVSAERFGPRVGLLLIGPLLLSGIFSVLYWWYTERVGVGDLRPYILVQYLPMLLVPLILVLFPKEAKYNRPYVIVMVSYMIAKGFEWQDGTVFAMTNHLVSGHTLKHLAAAAGLLMFKPQAIKGEGIK
jgi:hypothetical protein